MSATTRVLALVLSSWPLAVTGVALGVTGLVLARRGHLMLSPAGEEAPRDLWPLGPRAARPAGARSTRPRAQRSAQRLAARTP